MVDVTIELKWLCALLGSLGVSHSGACSLFCDRKSALCISQNHVFHERTKYIEFDCRYIRDAIHAGLVFASHVPTTEQLVDIFSKALGTRQFLYLLGLGIVNPYAPT